MWIWDPDTGTHAYNSNTQDIEAEESRLHALNIYIWKYDFTTVSAAVNGKSSFKEKGSFGYNFKSQSIIEGKLSPQELETVIQIKPHNQEQKNDTIYA